MGFFDEVYRGTPPWEIGMPQREFVALEVSGQIAGDVLDVGCGTGENALYLAGRGHVVRGVDSAAGAIRTPRRRARDRGVRATFLVQDALLLHGTDRTFDTVTDSGLFHTLSDDERPGFARSLSAALRPGGPPHARLRRARAGEYSLPRRVSQQEIRTTFSYRVAGRLDPARGLREQHAAGRVSGVALLHHPGLMIVSPVQGRRRSGGVTPRGRHPGRHRGGSPHPSVLPRGTPSAQYPPVGPAGSRS